MSINQGLWNELTKNNIFVMPTNHKLHVMITVPIDTYWPTTKHCLAAVEQIVILIEGYGHFVADNTSIVGE